MKDDKADNDDPEQWAPTDVQYAQLWTHEAIVTALELVKTGPETVDANRPDPYSPSWALMYRFTRPVGTPDRETALEKLMDDYYGNPVAQQENKTQTATFLLSPSLEYGRR